MRTLPLVALLVLVALSSEFALAQSGRPRPPTGRPPRGGANVEEFYTLGGRVFFHEQMRPAVRVRVRLYATSGGLVGLTFTDERGVFEFPGLGRATYLVEVAEDGFHTVRQRVELYLGSRSDTNILLERPPAVAAAVQAGPVSVGDLRLPPEARKEFEKGLDQLYEKQQPQRSLPHFRRVIELHPEFAEAYLQLALAHLRRGEFTPSREALLRAVELAPGDFRAHTVLGLAHNGQGQWRQAAEVLEQAVALKGDFWQAHYELGKALEQLGRWDDAYRHAQRAHQLNAAEAGIHLLRYNLCVRRGDYPAAVAELDEFLERFPAHPKAADLHRKREGLRQVLASGQPPQP